MCLLKLNKNDISEEKFVRKIAVLLVLVIVFCSLVGCSNSNSQNGKKADKGIWSVQKTTDEFGDVTTSSQDVISASVQGTYENEITTESEFNVLVDFRKRKDANHYIVEFLLTENNTSKIQYEEATSKRLKIKVGEKIQEFYLSLEESSGKFSIGNEDFDRIDYSGDYIFSNLYDGKDIKCIIEINDASLYSFELKSDNFKELCETNNFTEGAGDLTVRESVYFLLEDKGKMIDESCDCLKDNYETFEVVKMDELKEVLNGTFLEISFKDVIKDSLAEDLHSYHRWLVWEYSAKTNEREQTGIYYVPKRMENRIRGHHAYDGYREFCSCSGKTDIKIDDDMVKIGEFEFEVRRISDDVFLKRWMVNDGGGVEPDYDYTILIKGEDFSSKYTLKDGVLYAQYNYIEYIPY